MAPGAKGRTIGKENSLNFLNNLKGFLMKPISTGILFLFALLLCAGCSGVPRTYYYRIDYPLEIQHDQSPNFPWTLGIGQFSADILYEGDRIVYRESPYEAQYYHYRRWIAPPKKIVPEHVRKDYLASGVFGKVVSLPSPQKVDYVLTGNVEAFEEVDEGSTWSGVVTIRFQLRDAKTKEIIWEESISERTTARKREPVEVVRAISESLNKTISRSISSIKASLQTNNTSAF
ncbi:MAG: hypothetical protein E2O78_04445 [Caldithrix sp.]|nr:MAG: hypothetical protein E2O78_04445 [Caldithrix sp.]